MTVPAFDARATLAALRRGAATASRISGLSGGEPLRSESGADGERGRDLAAAVRAALADGAERQADPDGWIVLVRPDGRRLVIAPGLLTDRDTLATLPPALPVVEAAASARPPFWSDAADPPVSADRCLCGGRRWWRAAEGMTWWCAACHAPPADPAIMEVQT